jgi:hypothetical protein
MGGLKINEFVAERRVGRGTDLGLGCVCSPTITPKLKDVL